MAGIDNPNTWYNGILVWIFRALPPFGSDRSYFSVEMYEKITEQANSRFSSPAFDLLNQQKILYDVTSQTDLTKIPIELCERLLRGDAPRYIAFDKGRAAAEISNLGKEKMERIDLFIQYKLPDLNWLPRSLEEFLDYSEHELFSFEGTFDSGNADETQESQQNNTSSVPAADRYVSVSDNQPEFDKLSRSLDDIKSEFAKDHNKNDLKIDNIDARLADIAAFEKQVDAGWVSSRQAQNLKETLEYLATICVSSAIILASASAALGSLAALFGAG